MNPSIWVMLFVGFIVAEILTVSLVSIWFAGGALLAALAAHFGAPGYAQFLIFFGVSLALLVPLKPWVQKTFNKSRTPTNVNAVIGKTGIVKEDIDTARDLGKVMLNGMEWSARTSDDMGTIPRGWPVKVIRVEGVKLVVQKMEEKE